MVKTSKPQKKLFEFKRKTNRRRESNPSLLIIDERSHHRHVRKLVHSNGEVTEWPIVQHWKCCVPQGTAGSNPALSAIVLDNQEFRMKIFAFSENTASGKSK